MRRMGWSWGEYCALPEGYVDPLIQLLRKEDRERRQAAQRKR
jgi:hypothetical protein